MAASRFDCHISADIDTKKSSMTKSLYSFQLGKYKTQTGHISPYNLHKTYITNNIHTYVCSVGDLLEAVYKLFSLVVMNNYSRCVKNLLLKPFLPHNYMSISHNESQLKCLIHSKYSFDNQQGEVGLMLNGILLSVS